MKILINESQEKLFLKKFSINTPKNENFIFDFVITEDNKYVIWMDQVISREDGFIGNIWENTWVINNIIKNGLNKTKNLINESHIVENIENILDNINWTKELFSEIISTSNNKNSDLIEEQLWDSIKNAASSVWDKTKDVAKKAGSGLLSMGKTLLMKGFVPLLRWVRKKSMESIGIVIDIVTAMLPATSGINKLVWVLIVILDIYEILTKDFDPEEPERSQQPYLMLIPDLIALAFTAAVAKPAKVGMEIIAKQGIKKAPAATITLLKSFLNKIPALKNMLSGFYKFIAKHFPGAKSVLDVVFKGIDKVLLGVENTIKQLLSKRGAIAVASGVGIAMLLKHRPLKLNDVGNDVAAVNGYLKNEHNNLWNINGCLIPNNIKNKLYGNKFTEDTKQAVMIWEKCVRSQGLYAKTQPDGEISGDELAGMVDVEMDDRNIITKYIPHKYKERATKRIGDVMTLMASGIEKGLKPIENKLNSN